jgi:hypothetical protein
MEPFTGTADTKAPFPSEIGITTVLVLLLASLTFATREPLPATSIFPSKLFSVFVSDIKKKLGVD